MLSPDHLLVFVFLTLVFVLFCFFFLVVFRSGFFLLNIIFENGSVIYVSAHYAYVHVFSYCFIMY